MTLEEDILTFLTTKEEGHYFNEIARHLAELGHKPLSIIEGKDALHPKVLSKNLKNLVKEGLVESDFQPGDRSKRGRKNQYRVTKKGIKHLTRSKIRNLYGLVGIKWAEENWSKGYEIRFLNDLSHHEAHKRYLLAWNPETKDIRLAQIFGTREFSKTSGGPRYLAQYVDRKKNPKAPIRQNDFFDFIKTKVKNLENDKEIGEAVREYYDKDVHNCFFGLLSPTESIAFGFPQELGHFNTLTFLGFDYLKDFPIIPEITLWVGGFELSENLLVKLEYRANLEALHTFSWLSAKKAIDPVSIDPGHLEEWLKRTWISGFSPRVGIVCKNLEENERCKKQGIRCLVLENEKGERNFSKCPILVKDLQEVREE